MASPWDDDEMLAMLARAQRAARSVPSDLVEAGRAAYTRRDIGAEVPGFTCGSALAAHFSTHPRAKLAHLCALTFTSTRLTIEIEITDEAVLGQVIPVQAGEVEVNTPAGTARTALIDDIGCFTIRPIPAGSFRLHCRTAGGTCVSTSWVTL